MWSKGAGRRRATNRAPELKKELADLRQRLASMSRDRDLLAEMLLRAQTEATRSTRERDAANRRVADIERTLEQVRSANEDLRDNTVTQPIPVLTDSGHASPRWPSGLPPLPAWARRDGFTYSRERGFGRLTSPMCTDPQDLAVSSAQSELST